jgi:hypothetical protein
MRKEGLITYKYIIYDDMIFFNDIYDMNMIKQNKAAGPVFYVE